MKYSNEKSLGEAIREMLENYNLQDKLIEADLISVWGELVGPMIQRHTTEVRINKKKLYVKIDSPAVKNELLYLRSQIIETLNNHAGKKVIEEIVLM